MAATKYLKCTLTYLEGQKLAMGSGEAWTQLQAKRVEQIQANVRALRKLDLEEASTLTSMIQSSCLDPPHREILARTFDQKLSEGDEQSKKRGRPERKDVKAERVRAKGAMGTATGASEPQGDGAVATGPATHSGEAAPPAASSDGISVRARTSATATEGNTTDQVHDFFHFYMNEEAWTKCGDPECPTDERLEILADIMALGGLLHPNEQTYGNIASLAMLDWPLDKIHGPMGRAKVVVLRQKIHVRRKVFHGKGAPARYPIDPKALPKEFYERTYSQAPPMRCPYDPVVIAKRQGVIVLRSSHGSVKSLGTTLMRANTLTGSSELAIGGHNSERLNLTPNPRTPNRSQATGGAASGEEACALLGQSIATAFPQVTNCLGEPWLQQALRNPQGIAPLWREMLANSPQKDIKIRFMNRALGGSAAEEPSSSRSEGTPAIGGDKDQAADTPASGGANEQDAGDGTNGGPDNATSPKQGVDLSPVLNNVLGQTAGGKTKRQPMKTMKRPATKAKKVHEPLAMKSAGAEGVRGEKDTRRLRYQAGPRAPFWYGRSKVFTSITSRDHGRYRLYKVSPRDNVETGYAFSTSATAKTQWEAVVAHLKRLNP